MFFCVSNIMVVVLLIKRETHGGASLRRWFSVGFVVFADAVGFVVGVEGFAVFADGFGHVCEVFCRYIDHHIPGVLANGHSAVVGELWMVAVVPGLGIEGFADLCAAVLWCFAVVVFSHLILSWHVASVEDEVDQYC